jgi:uncharacterized protein with HEPN domain
MSAEKNTSNQSSKKILLKKPTLHIKDSNKLDVILESIRKIESYTAEFKNEDEFNNNTQVFDATMMNFVVIGEMVSKLSEEFKDAHPEIEWHKIKGLRNIAAHDYFGIDAEEIWQIIHTKLPELREYITSIL